MTIETLKDFIQAVNNNTLEDINSWYKYVKRYRPIRRRFVNNTFIIFQKGIDKETIEDVLLIDQHNLLPVWFEYLLHLLESGDVIVKAVNGTYSRPTNIKGYQQREMFFYRVFNDYNKLKEYIVDDN
jgi:hypothetical protein